MFNWNDLKYFVALARHGSTLAAGRALSTDASTVQRRIAELERHVGQPLVKRETTGYQLTAFGRQMLVQAQAVEHAVQAFEQQLAVARREAGGVIRVTCPEPLVTRISQSPLLQRFHERHPGLQVEFVMSDQYLDLAKGQADVALRSGDTDDAGLVGRKIGDSLWAVYGSRTYLDRQGRPKELSDLARHALVGLEDGMAQHRAAQWLRGVAPDTVPVARNSSVLGLVHSVKAGIGLAPLPTALGDAEPELERVLGPIPELTRIWRVLTTPELRHSPRVAAFFDFIVDEIDTLKPIITG
ncbi:MAG: LysR family transcriptional regulator [Cytophagales bacterium]|nr:LysR family transcriptional regulator [Rhizobacter sp.]